MKTNAIIRIVIYSIVILLIVSILGGFLAFDRYSFHQEDSSCSPHHHRRFRGISGRTIYRCRCRISHPYGN